MDGFVEKKETEDEKNISGILSHLKGRVNF